MEYWEYSHPQTGGTQPPLFAEVQLVLQTPLTKHKAAKARRAILKLVQRGAKELARRRRALADARDFFTPQGTFAYVVRAARRWAASLDD